MNFSNTKGLKKLLSLILAGTMLLGLFTGCMKKDVGDTVPSTESGPNLNLDLDDTQPTTSIPETTIPETTAPVITENTAMVINQLTIRNSPSKDATAVGTLDAGDMVEILRDATAAGIRWGLISEPQAGWICMDYVEMMNANGGNDISTSTPGNDNPAATTPDNTTTTFQSYKGVVTGSELNIRNDSSTNGTLIGQYKKGDVVTILETKNGWGRTDKGWVNLAYINASTTNTSTGNTTTGNTSTGGTTSTGNGSTSVVFKGIVTAKELNVRSTPSTSGDRIKSLSKGTRVEILEKDDDWGRISDGWISLNYVYQDGTKGTNTAKGIITGSGLNIRSGPGTKYDSVGNYSKGDRVSILEQFTIGESTWGCTDKGWISMSYVYVDGTDVGESGGGVVNTDGLRIRSGPGTSYDVVATYDEGDEITILYQVTVGDTTWGCTSTGWVSLAYVDLD